MSVEKDLRTVFVEAPFLFFPVERKKRQSMSTLRNEKCPPPHHFFPLFFLHISRPLTKKSDPTSWIDPSPPFLLPPPPPSCLRSGRGGGGGIKNRRSCKGEPPLNFPELSRLRSGKGGVPPTAAPMSTPLRPQSEIKVATAGEGEHEGRNFVLCYFSTRCSRQPASTT